MHHIEKLESYEVWDCRLAMLIYSGLNIMNLCVPNGRLLDGVLG